MKTFKTIAVVKHPREIVWQTIRDRLDELAPLLGNIEDVSVQSRTDGPDGVRLVNVWRAKVPIPESLTAVIKPDMLAWTDHADWRDRTWECQWQITPHFFSDRIHCVGATRYEDAMAGRGTRITFQGDLNVLASNIPGASALLESFTTQLIPRNFQKLGKAVAQHLEATSKP
ncbi:MAG: hypothetical protein ACFCVB_22065 [Nodosilinea sp.]